MRESTVIIDQPEGVHARPASIFVREAGKFQAEIHLSCNGTTVNGKSIMGLLMLALGRGSEVTISASGDDEEEAVSKLTDILSGRYE